MSVSVPAAELAQRFEMLRQINELTAERDKARLQNKVLQATLNVTIRERDEARSLGRCA